MHHPVLRVDNDVEYRNGNDGDTLLLKATPVDTIHAVEVDGVALVPADYQVDRDAGIIRRINGWWPSGLGNVKITYTHGWETTAIPGDIEDAVLEHAATIAKVLIHLQQNSAGSTQESYGQAAMVGTTSKWVEAVERHRRNIADRS